jgi:hypothetical protein
MPRRTETVNEENRDNEKSILPKTNLEREDEIAKLNRMLGAVMKYISDDEIVEIDIEYLLDNTEDLRNWWNEYREKDRKRVEKEIKKSLEGLSLEELEKLREQIMSKEEK